MQLFCYIGNVSTFTSLPLPTDIDFYQTGQCFFVSSFKSNSIKRISLDGTKCADNIIFLLINFF